MIKYDLHSLGWNAFQHLCLTICREILGQTVSIYLDSNDAGKDGAFSGLWKQVGEEDLKGKFVIQCKFTSKPAQNLSMTDIADELEKTTKLVADGRCDCYILLTNAGISGTFDEKFQKAFAKIGVNVSKVFGNDWICTQIQESKRLRMMVPRLYGLGDLSQILDERAYAQAKQLLISMRDDLAKIVMTSAYFKAAKAMDEHGYVLIIGEAAAGKTTIASMLAMAAVDQWKLETLKIDRPQLVTKHWNPEDPGQFFWIDDAFGVTQYESDLVNGWNHILPQVKSMLKQGIKIVMTSRDYIYRSARKELKESAFPLFNESQVVIDVHKLEIEEKEQILYNHLKLGRQNPSFLAQIKPFLPEIATHDRFIPETARRLADPAFTKKLYLYSHTLADFVDKQEGFMMDTITGLDVHSRAALALIYMSNGYLQSPIKLTDEQSSAIERLGSNLGEGIAALEAMRDSFVQYVYVEEAGGWRYKHPTIGDAYSKIISESPEQLEIYLQGTSVEKIMDQVTCGDVGVEKAIVITKDHYPIIMSKIADFSNSESYKTVYLSTWAAEQKVFRFLARRCSITFLKLYIDNNEELLKKIVKPSMSFDYSAKINLVVKLHSESLLPENYRKEFVDYITHFTVKGDDLTLLKDDDLQSVFSKNELDKAKAQLRSTLVPKIDGMLEQRIAEFRKYNDDSAQEHMDDLIERYGILLEEFENEEELTNIIENQISETKSWIGENDFPQNSERPDRKLESKSPDEVTDFKPSRSIFDDIDDIK